MNFRKVKLFLLGLPKTLRVNFHYFDFITAVKLPILLTHKVRIKKLKGSIELQHKIKRGMISFGFLDVSISDTVEPSIFNVEGKIIFKGSAGFGAGTKFAVGKSATLVFGDNFLITANSEIACFKSIIFGDNCLISWDILIMDTDAHSVFDSKGHKLNEDKPIIVGNNVWIGCRSLLLKGTSIPDGCIIGAQSVLNKKYDKPNCLLAGSPANSVKENIFWNRKTFTLELNENIEQHIQLGRNI